MPPPEIVGPATLAMSSSLGLFQNFLPKFTDIKNGSPHDVGFCMDVRLGEIAAASLTLGVGAIASSLSGSAIPIIVGAVMAGFLIALYETALRYEGP